jgi:hypothetical protein
MPRRQPLDRDRRRSPTLAHLVERVHLGRLDVVRDELIDRPAKASGSRRGQPTFPITQSATASGTLTIKLHMSAMRVVDGWRSRETKARTSTQ